MFRVNNKDTRCRSGVFIVNFEHILHLIVVCQGVSQKMETDDVFSKLGN